mmetsp:Transcript_25968/g.85397  ORF Transcript_25968/g.85397 Transcript_25968/m.85397 type:complete len:219 (-) Transcript_25968:1273-1929(-)
MASSVRQTLLRRPSIAAARRQRRSVVGRMVVATAHSRRGALLGVATAAATLSASATRPPPALADDFTVTPSGLRFLDIRPGDGAVPEAGDTVVIQWSGYTSGYQGKRIERSTDREEPYEFKLGAGTVIPAFEEAVGSMKVGGIRRMEVPGDLPELSYPRKREERFVDATGLRYRYGPQPDQFDGQRALDFVLDNPTLKPFNRTLLFDVRLLAVRKRKQ